MSDELKAPYKPSWVDRYFDWIDKLPIPSWLFYLLLFLFTTTFANLPYWVEGLHPFFSFTAAASVGGLWLPVQQGATHLLDRSVKAALKSFRPAMKADKEEFARLLFEMENMPSGIVLLMTVFIPVAITYMALFAPEIFGNELQSSAGRFLTVIGFILGFLFAPILLYAAFRLVRLVNFAYTLTSEINLFKLQPLYALSSLTAKAGIALFLLVPLNYLQNIVLNPYGLGLEFVVVMTAIGGTIALAAFIVPLWATHIRIVEQKEEQLAKNGAQLSQLVELLAKHVENKKLEDMEQLEKGIAALLRVREAIEKTSTWPWESSTLRGLLSAVMLPIFLFVVQQILVRVL